MALEKLQLWGLERLPKNLVSRAFGGISEVAFPGPMQRVVNRSFLAISGAELDEAPGEVGDYETLNALFTRQLREGTRSVETDRAELVSPVDGALGMFGAIEEGTLLQAKGREYRLLDLVDSAEAAERYQGGHYATIYLSPKDYHRIHSPVGGEIERFSYIPGHLFPVNPLAVENIDNLFAVNERLITYIQSATLGEVAVIKVGATCVGRITLTHERFETNRPLRRRQEWAPTGDELGVEAGDELAVFNLGSTVILLIEEGSFAFREDLSDDSVLRVGEAMGEGNTL